MSQISLQSVGAIQAFIGDVSGFLGRFSQECDDLEERISRARWNVESELSTALNELQQAQDELDAAEEPTDAQYEAVREAEEHASEWSMYNDRFQTFAQNAQARLFRISDDQVRAATNASNYLGDITNLAAKYRSIQPDRGGTQSAHKSGPRDSNAPVPGEKAAKAAQASALRLGDLTRLPRLPNGMKWIKIDDLDWNDVDADLKFRKASEEEIQAMLKVFETKLLPALNAHTPVDADELAAADLAAGRTDSRTSLSFAYQFMIGNNRGSDVIALDAPHPLNGERYTWQSGRHRAKVARSLGWKVIPVRIVGGEG